MMKSSMSKIETNDVMVGPVVSEGGRSQSTLSPGHGGVGQRGLAPGQRWSVGRKREVVLRLLRGESVELLSRELGVSLYRLEQWRQKADAALDGALKEREVDPAAGELSAATAMACRRRRSRWSAWARRACWCRPETTCASRRTAASRSSSSNRSEASNRPSDGRGNSRPFLFGPPTRSRM